MPPRRGAPRGALGGGTRLRFLAPGGQADPYATELPLYQMGPGSQPQGVQLLPWNQLDPFVQTGSPIAMAEGGQPPADQQQGGLAGVLKYLTSMKQQTGGGGGSNRPPDARGGVVSMIGSDVDAGMGASSDPRFAALDPRSRAIAKINERLQQQSSLSGAQNATASIMGRGMGRPGLANLAPRAYNEFSSYLTAPKLADGGKVGMLNVPPFITESESDYPSYYERPRASQGDVRAEDIRQELLARRRRERSNRIYTNPMAPAFINSGIQHPFNPRRGFAEGGEVGMSGEDALMLGAGLGASRLRPRHINRMARPVMRALSKPVLGMESVTSDPLTRPMSDLRYNFARKMTPHPYAELPVHRGQGAWQGEKGMEYNPLYMQELPRRAGKLIDDQDAMYYAGQMGENLEQAATPVNRFVPHLMNTPEESNAMMIPDVNARRLREIASSAGPDWVTAHRPGNRAMMFPLGDEPLEPMARKLGVEPRYGRSDQDVDRVLLARKPLGYESGLYSDFGAMKRNPTFEARERQALAPSGDRMVETFARLRAAETSGAK